MKKGPRFDTTKLAEWTKKVGTKIKETAEALEVEFNDDGGGGNRADKVHQNKVGWGQFNNTQNASTTNNNRFAALQPSSASNSQSSFIDENNKDDVENDSTTPTVTLNINVFETADIVQEKLQIEKELEALKEERKKREKEFESKLREMEEKRSVEMEKSKANNNALPASPKNGGESKKTDDDDAAVPTSRQPASSPLSLEIELKAIKNVAETLKNQLKERDERITKMIAREKETKELNESLTQKNSQMQTSLDVLRKKQKENDAAKDRDMLETSQLKDVKRTKEKQEKELEREKKMREEVQKKYEKAHKDWLDLTTNQAKEKKELSRLQKSEEMKSEKIEKLEEQLLQTKLELEDFKLCKKERDDALQKLNEVREEIVDLKHEKSAYENNAEDLRLVNEAREVAEKALVEESKKTIELEKRLRELSEEKANNNDNNNNNNNDDRDNSSNRHDSTGTRKKNMRTDEYENLESASSTPKKDNDGIFKTTSFSSGGSTATKSDNSKEMTTTVQGSSNDESSSTIAELKSEIAALKNQLELLSREKEDKIAVIDSDRAQLQRQLEEAKKTAAKLIKEKLESIQIDFKRSKEKHAKETGLLKEEIEDLEEDRNEWKRKCEKARDETELVRNRAREMLVEKEEELERALFNADALAEGKKISQNCRKASASRLMFLDDDEETEEKKKSLSSSKPPQAPTTSSSPPNESDFLYLKNVLLQYLTTNERLVHERLVPVVTTLLKCSDEERAKVIAARVNMKPSSFSSGSQPNTPTRGGGIRLLNTFFRT